MRFPMISTAALLLALVTDVLGAPGGGHVPIFRPSRNYFSSSEHGLIGCDNVTGLEGTWVWNGNDTNQCVSLVKRKCDNMIRYTTQQWVMGIEVRHNCDKIRPWTAIATFTADGDKYPLDHGHAAIFESCSPPNCIWVYDQNVTQQVHRQRFCDYADNFSTIRLP
ncbi:domesticated amidase effector 2-like [Ornithodoros turicata]|uniref:domesticated amidase effector 2-like n=1 Tax=Ornithodoros turicata TaxID=34597 RepID=UPI003139D6CF